MTSRARAGSRSTCDFHISNINEWRPSLRHSILHPRLFNLQYQTPLNHGLSNDGSSIPDDRGTRQGSDSKVLRRRFINGTAEAIPIEKEVKYQQKIGREGENRVGAKNAGSSFHLDGDEPAFQDRLPYAPNRVKTGLLSPDWMMSRSPESVRTSAILQSADRIVENVH